MKLVIQLRQCSLTSTDISGNKPDAGKQFVAVKLKVENTFGQDIQMFSTDFLLEWDKTSADDKGVDGPHSYYDKDAIFNEEFEKEYTLTSGESKEGVLVFEIPEGVTDVSLITINKATSTKVTFTSFILIYQHNSRNKAELSIG